jgi:SM-20-related protein
MNFVTAGIVAAIAEHGYYVGPTILSIATTAGLADRLCAHIDSGALHEARVGRATQSEKNMAVRGDATLWLDDTPANSVEADALQAIHQLRSDLNEALYVGATSIELHYAHYPAGTYYTRHLDRFRDDDTRVVSLVFYLNDDWQEASGGELVIYDEQHAPLQRVVPRAGTMVAFLSDRFPHEVLPATQARLSLTGWMRRRSVR